MIELKDEELLLINGGANFSGVMINSLVRGMIILLDIGRSFGSALRRIHDKKMCTL